MSRPLTEIDRIIQAQRERAERAAEPREQGAAISPAGVEAVRMRVKSIGDDTLTCHTWDGSTDGSANITVAKPLHLQRTPYDGETINGYTYTYSDGSSRQSDDGSTTEDQVITEPYYVDAEIIAIGPIVGGSGVAGVRWIDSNVTGRAWAKGAT